MNKTNLRRLQELELTADRKKYPNFPENARTTTRWGEGSANALTKSVMGWLKLNGYHAERVNTMGTPKDNRKVVTDVLGRSKQIGSIEWRRTTATKGSADIHAVIEGRFYAFEIKFGADKQSEAQRAYQENIERTGGVYLIVNNFDDFIKWYDLSFPPF